MTRGAFHLLKISGISGSAVNGTRFVGSSHWKIPRKSGKSKKVVPFSRLEFPNGISCSTYRGLRPNGTTFYQSEIPLLLPPKFPGFFPKWKAPKEIQSRQVKKEYHKTQSGQLHGVLELGMHWVKYWSAVP